MDCYDKRDSPQYRAQLHSERGRPARVVGEYGGDPLAAVVGECSSGVCYPSMEPPDACTVVGEGVSGALEECDG